MKNKFPKILIFFGSPHSNGFTSQILNYVTDTFYESKITIKKAFEENIKPCIDCGFCKCNAKCIFDDMEEIYSLLESADILIIAFPVYNFSLPAPLKAIIDRLQKYYNQKFALKTKNKSEHPKKCIIITTQGSSVNESETQRILNFQLSPILGLLNFREIRFLTVCGTDSHEFNMSNYLQKNKSNIQEKIKYY